MRHGIDPYGTIPRKHGLSLGVTPQDSYRSINTADLDSFRARKPSGLSFGKGFFRLKTGKRSCSAPNLGDGLFYPLCLSL